jgi:hypothetical protein
MKVKRRGTGIIQLLSIPPINLDLKLDRDMQVMMKEDIPIGAERPDRNMIEKIHQLGEIGNRNIELKLIQMNMTMRTIPVIIIERNHTDITDRDHIPTFLLHFHFEDTRPHRVFSYLIKCLILVICLCQEGIRGQGLGQCNMLLPQVHSLDMEEGWLRQAVGEVGTHHQDL